MNPLKALGGTSDILPEEARAWQRLEEIARWVFHLYGYKEIRTPLIEEAAVFTSSLGEAAEIVIKQMYLFEDRGGRKVALRPEGTASVVRALVEHGLDKTAGVSRFFYGGPMFRAERPQKGRRRQFHQIGVEVFGSASPYQDIETILLLGHLLNAWGIQGWTINLNSLGCKNDRPEIIQLVREKLALHKDKLCEDCKVRYEKNPLRILDCKEEGCRKLAEPVDVIEAICGDCSQHFKTVMAMLTEQLKMPGITRNPHLVRGLDYYTRTAFEVTHPGLGSQDALGGGGRYDDLVQMMGGAPTPAIGFAVGMERVMLALESAGGLEQPAAVRPVYVVAVEPPIIPLATVLAQQFRFSGMPAYANLEDRPVGKQLKIASTLNARYALILGPDEVKEASVMVKDLDSGEQHKEPISTIVEKLKSNGGQENA